MKKIFYSLMAVALCACSQSDVDDSTVTPQQPGNDGVTFTVVDNGFVGEDGTRVTYGDGVSYAATFEEGDQIGVYAITAMDADTKTPTAYKFENKPLTLTNGVWKSSESLDLTDVKVLFAYAPYREDASVTGDYVPTFTGADGSWAVDNSDIRNAFFVGGNTYNVTDNSTKEKFEAADWMGAATNVTNDTKEVTFNMIHMRGMVELTTHKDVVLEDLTLAIGGDNGAKYHFTPYHIETADKHVYRILTTEYRYANTVYATIKDLNITKKYKKTPAADHKGAGKCIQVNIGYVPPKTITVTADKSLATTLTEMYGAEYATAPTSEFTSLRLAGTLSDADWATLQSLTTVTSLDMYQLNNTSIPNNWMKNSTKLKETLNTLVLPNGLTTIGGDALQFPANKVISIELPASVTTIGNGAFYDSQGMSICIPANSNLQTIGQGAFLNARAVYTDPASVNVLRIPASVTKIDGAAFGGVQQLNKFVFQSDVAPEIVNGAYAVTFNNGTTAYVPNTSYKVEGDNRLFPGMTVIVGPALTVDNYKAVYKDGTSNTSTWEGSLSALCDGPAQTHWHSDYGSAHNYDKWGIYIDIVLPKAYSNLKLSYTSRWNGTNQIPQRVMLGVATDNGEFAEAGTYDINDDATALATEANETKVLAISATSSYNKVRFGIIRTPQGTASGDGVKVWAALSELTVYEETWTEEPTPANQ